MVGSKRSQMEKDEWLTQQLEDTQRIEALLDRFERVTQNWIKRIEVQEKPR